MAIGRNRSRSPGTVPHEVSVLGEHGPRMLNLMSSRKTPCPRFTAQQMDNLVAYLNSL